MTTPHENVGSVRGVEGNSDQTSARASAERPDGENESVGSIVSRVSNDLSTLLRQELELAKAEMRAEAKTAGKGVGMLTGAALAGWLAVLFASITLMWLLDKAMDLTWAALIVTALWAVIAAGLAVTGRKTLAHVNPKPEETMKSLKEDAQWLKPQRS